MENNKSELTRQALIDIGFKEVPHYTVMQSLVYDLGRSRYLSIGCLGAPNEMLIIGQFNNDCDKEITDVVVLKNFDYDGCVKMFQIKMIISAITGHIFED